MNMNLYWSWYQDETLKEAQDACYVGYKTLEEAVEDSIINDPFVPFVIMQAYRPVYIRQGCKDSFLKEVGAL